VIDASSPATHAHKRMPRTPRTPTLDRYASTAAGQLMTTTHASRLASEYAYRLPLSYYTVLTVHRLPTIALRCTPPYRSADLYIIYDN